MRIVTVALLVLFLVPAWASEPGEPLDCSDWVILEPGYSCSVWWSESSGVPLTWLDQHHNTIIDNESRLITVELEEIPRNLCTWPFYRTSVVRTDGTERQVIGYIDDRCNPDLTESRIKPSTPPSCTGNICISLEFDPVHGRLLIPVFMPSMDGVTPGAGYFILAIEGFTSTFDILQTYDPTSGPLSFRVPTIPEGFQYADYFDTFWGDLASVGDWSLAQPLQCGYPSTAPSVGDYLTVEDTLPTPAAGDGYYYVTAVNYQGQRRYGRRSNGGVLSGRDPAVLPACEAQARARASQ